VKRPTAVELKSKATGGRSKTVEKIQDPLSRLSSPSSAGKLARRLEDTVYRLSSTVKARHNSRVDLFSK